MRQSRLKFFLDNGQLFILKKHLIPQLKISHVDKHSSSNEEDTWSVRGPWTVERDLWKWVNYAREKSLSLSFSLFRNFYIAHNSVYWSATQRDSGRKSIKKPVRKIASVSGNAAMQREDGVKLLYRYCRSRFDDGIWICKRHRVIGVQRVREISFVHDSVAKRFLATSSEHVFFCLLLRHVNAK